MIARYAQCVSLSSFMCVSPTTFLVARKIVWKTVPSVLYALRLIPSVSLVFGRWVSLTRYPPPNDVLYQFSKSIPFLPLVASWEWERFDLYAPFIRHFITTSSSKIMHERDIDPCIFRRLKDEKNAPGPLFPNLRSITLSGHHFYLEQSLTSICRVEALVDFSAGYVPDTDALLEAIAPSAKRLECLSLCGPIFHSQRVLQLMEVFQSLRKLVISEKASPQPQNTLIFSFLNDLPPKIRHISLSFDSKVRKPLSTPEAPKSLRAGALVGVEHLELEGSAHLMTLILGAGVFRTVFLCFSDAELVSSYHTCLEALSRGSSDSLEKLILRSESVVNHDFPTIRCIYPLLTAKKIRVLEVHSWRHVLNISITDGDIKKIVSSWPQLMRIHMLTSFGSPSADDRECQPGLNGLRLLTQLPNISSIAIQSFGQALRLQFPLCDALGQPPLSEELVHFLTWVKDIHSMKGWLPRFKWTILLY